MKTKRAMKTETQYKLHYTKLDGSRAEKTFPTLARLEAALAKTKAENAGHDMQDSVEPFEVEVPEQAVTVSAPRTGPSWKIMTKDEDTGEWRDADESDGLDSENDFPDHDLAKSEMRRMVNRCAYRFPAKVIRA